MAYVKNFPSLSLQSDSVRPHRWQPTRLPHPWDFPGKNTGVDCHFLLQCMKVKSESEVSQSSLTLHDPMDFSLPGSSTHEIFQARVLEWVSIAFSIVKNKCIQISKFGIIFMSIYVYGPSVSAQVQISSVTHCGLECPGLTLLGKLSKE